MTDCKHDSWFYDKAGDRICADCTTPLNPLAVSVEDDPYEEHAEECAKSQERCQCGHKRKHHQAPDCLRCLAKGELRFLHPFTPTQIPDPLVPVPEPGIPLAVVYILDGGMHREMLIPPGAAVAHVNGGILVQHEDREVARIHSVRQLIPGEVHAAEDHE